MIRTLMYPSSGACGCSVELSHRSFCSWFHLCWSFGVVGLQWYPCCRLKHNTHGTKNNMTNVVIQQNSRKLLMMDILMSETCWTHKKWNKIASYIKLVFYSSTITMMHDPINIRLSKLCLTTSLWRKCVCRTPEIRPWSSCFRGTQFDQHGSPPSRGGGYLAHFSYAISFFKSSRTVLVPKNLI